MITFTRVHPAQMAEAHRKAEPPVPPPDPINVHAVLGLHRPRSVPFRGAEYPARWLTMPESLEMQLILRTLKTTDLEGIEERADAYNRACALFWSLLYPRPRENPFVDLEPVEIGETAGFISRYLTRQSGSSQQKPDPKVPRH